MMAAMRMVCLGAVCLGALVVLAGCPDEETGETTAGGGDTTSGSEDGAGGGSASGEGGGSGWDGDNPEGSAAGQTGGGGSSAWDSPVAETGRPLPPRRPMSGSARGSYQQGLQAAASGNDAAARQAFEAALSADRNAYKAAYNLGVLSDRAGNEARALEYYRRALSIQADYERAAEGIVTIHLRRGNTAEALSFIEPLARQWERNLYLQALYADVLVQANRLDDAVTAARAALRRDERFVPAMVSIVKASLKQGRRELATAVIDQALEIDAQNAELHYLKGRLLLEEDGRLREALDSLRRAVQLRPDFMEARMALGVQLLHGANYTEALQHLQAAAALAPTSVEPQLNLGEAYRTNKQWPQAKAAFEKALSMRSSLPQAHFNMGLMYMAAGANFPGLDAVAALRRAVESFTRYRNEMGARLPRNDPAEGYIEDLNRQIEREQRRIEREQAQAQRAAERGARPDPEGGGE